jgi:SEC-C motif
MNMNGMVAVCENPSCGAIFGTKEFVSGPGNATIHMIGSRVGPCPRCGSMGAIPDGVYEYKDFLASFVSGPKESIETLSKVKAILEAHQKRSQPATKQDIIDEIEKVSTRLAEVVKQTPHTSSFIEWLTFTLTVITFLILIQQTYLKPKDKADDSKVYEMFIQHLLDDNKKLTDTNLKLDSLRTNTLNNKKVGRNDPCPCKSGLKYKKCCGKPSKN